MGAINDAADMLVVALDDAGISVTRDPASVDPPCALIGLPNFNAPNSKTIEANFPVRLIALPPNNLDQNLGLLDLADQICAMPGVLVVDGSPSTYEINDHSLPAYTLSIQINVLR